MSASNKIEYIYDFIDHDKELKIDDSLKTFLTSIKKTNLYQYLSYILKEMVGNANKANLKRVHFLLNQLDITKKNDYEQGIETFKEYLSKFTEKYLKEIGKKGFYIKIIMVVVNNNFVVIVENNNKILPIELGRINEKIKNAIRFNTMEEAVTQALDQSEGAGFGLILSLMMLRKIGLNEKAFKISDKENMTEVSISIPLNLLDKDEQEFIADSIKNEIKDIPQFPQHIIELQTKLLNPNANFNDLSEIINRDPNLIADILKVANSSIYMIPNKVKTIDEAVRQIGFKGVRNLVLTYSVQKLLSEKYNFNAIKETMDHSSEVAFYAFELAKVFKLKNISDETYTAAILHDFGKILINYLNPKLVKSIERLCHEKDININLVENLTNGFNHSLIGAKLAEKWNFPDNIIETIKFHHLPLEANDENKDLVYIVYLSNIFYYYKDNKFQFEDINYQVLKYLNLTDKKDFDEVFKKINSIFEQRKIEKLK